MGWNSFDSYGVYLHEEAALANIEAMAAKLKPFGYEYFVIDNGWFGEYQLHPGTHFAREKHASDINLDAHGYYVPSRVYFPRGFAPLIARCHELGLKFGVHLMRGIPRKASELNLPIEGTPYTARDIVDANPAHHCTWCTYNYGVDLSKPGAQAWYDGLIRHLAKLGVDFIKYDDIVPFPREVEAVAEAIRKVDRPIMLSLSPGYVIDPQAIRSFQQANMLRVTQDIWDDQLGIDRCFAAWRAWNGRTAPNFWIDMDMIPFGELQVMSPPRRGAADTPAQVALAGKGTRRWSQFSPDQMQTFITLRALAASPLFVGGDLLTIDPYSLRLITEPEVIACNQNGVMGRLVREDDRCEVWLTPEKTSAAKGWIGVFNRSTRSRDASLSLDYLGLTPTRKYRIADIWNGSHAIALRGDETSQVTIPRNGVLFLRFEALP